MNWFIKSEQKKKGVKTMKLKEAKAKSTYDKFR